MMILLKSFILSIHYAEQFGELTKTHEDFCTVRTWPYTLYPYEDFSHCNEELENFNDARLLAKPLRNGLYSLLSLDNVELSSQNVSMRTPRIAWFHFIPFIVGRMI
jgi:hypothetical protein